MSIFDINFILSLAGAAYTFCRRKPVNFICTRTMFLANSHLRLSDLARFKNGSDMAKKPEAKTKDAPKSQDKGGDKAGGKKSGGKK